MAAIAATPIFLRDVLLTLKVGAAAVGEYQCFARIAAIKVTQGDVVTTQTLCSDGSFSQPGKATYSLTLEGVQDWSADGLSRYLWTNDGEIADFVLNAHGEDASAGRRHAGHVRAGDARGRRLRRRGRHLWRVRA